MRDNGSIPHLVDWSSSHVTVVPPAADLSTDTDALATATGNDTAAVYVQSPNYYGVIEDVETIVATAHDHGRDLCGQAG